MSTMEMMEVDPSTDQQKYSEIQLWYLQSKEGIVQKKAQTNISELNIGNIKDFVLQEMKSFATSVDEIDIIHHGKILKSDEDIKSIRPKTVLNVIKRRKQIPLETPKPASKEAINQVCVALRTAFFNPAFIPTLNTLGESDKLENIFAIAPGLEEDPIGIAIIQDPAVLYHLSDAESLKKLAATRPWVVEALNYISATVHQEKATHGQHLNLAARYNPIFEGDEEDVDEGDEEGAAGGPRAGPSGGLLGPITREQLTAALGSLNSLGLGVGMPSANQNVPSADFGESANWDYFGTTVPGGPSASSNTGQQGSTTQNSLQDGISNSQSGPALTTELVARAMNEALRNLPPEQRAQQFNAIRTLANQLQQTVTSATPPTVHQNAVPPSTMQPQAPTGSVNTNGAAGYQIQLAQMREVGINDERLSIMALRVSDGDVSTAIELIFSGWQGEGADPSI